MCLYNGSYIHVPYIYIIWGFINSATGRPHPFWSTHPLLLVTFDV